MTLSVSASKTGAVIKGEVQFGQVLLVNNEDAYNIIAHDINRIQEWAPNLVSCAILDNRFEAWEVGARRRLVIGKAPYKDIVLREILSEKFKSDAGRARCVFTYSPLEGEETSFSSLKLDSHQKYAKCMAQKGAIGEPEEANISERMHYDKFGNRIDNGSSQKSGVAAAAAGASSSSGVGRSSIAGGNKYASEEPIDEPLTLKTPMGRGTGFAPLRSLSTTTPTTGSASSLNPIGFASTRSAAPPDDATANSVREGGAVVTFPNVEAPTLLSMKTTYSFNALSGGIATTGKAPQLGATAGELRCFMEILIEYTISCETPGEYDERLLYDHTVLRDFLEKFWVRELAESFANYAHAQAYHLTDGSDPLKGPAGAGYGSIKKPSTAAATSTSSVLGGPSDARVNAVADKLGLRFAEEQEQYDSAVSLLAAKAKTAEDDRVAETMLKLLSSWERVTGELKRSQEMVERMAHELDAAKLITNAATGFNAATERGRVVYDFEEQKKL